MAVTTIFIDSHDHLATTEGELKYLGAAAVINAKTSDTRFGTGEAANLCAILRSGLVTAQRAWVFGLAYRPTTTDVRIAEILESALPQSELRYGTSGFLELYSGGSLLQRGTHPLRQGVWGYIEWATFIDNTVGTSCVQLNGAVMDINVSGVDTQGQAANNGTRYEFGHDVGGNPQGDFDDIYVRTGATLGTGFFLGDVRVRAVYPDGAGASTQWTPDSGTNFERVDETTNDNDTSYVETATVTERDSYTFGDVPTDATIFGITLVATATRVTSGNTVTPYARVGGTNYDGTATATQVAVYKPSLPSLFLVSPDTSVAWTATEVNASEFGILKL